MLTAALEGLIERYNLHGLRMGEVAAGAVLKHSRDLNLTRECAGLAPVAANPGLRYPAGLRHRAGGGLLVANKIALGQIECGIAGGVDTTSDAPIGVNEGLRQILLQANRSKSMADKLKPCYNFAPSPQAGAAAQRRAAYRAVDGPALRTDGADLADPRAEQDQLALESHQKMAAAYAEGWHNDLLTPFLGLTRDNNLRPT
jgi:acetyl-CoA C-acetyltransferase